MKDLKVNAFILNHYIEDEGIAYYILKDEELNAVENYRSLMFALSEQWMRDYLTEIYTDEQNHAAKLSFLYSKYLK